MGKGEKGQPTPADQPDTTYHVLAYDLNHFLPLHCHSTKQPSEAAHHVQHALRKGVPLVIVRATTPPPLDQHQQEALFT